MKLIVDFPNPSPEKNIQAQECETQPRHEGRVISYQTCTPPLPPIIFTCSNNTPARATTGCLIVDFPIQCSTVNTKSCVTFADRPRVKIVEKFVTADIKQNLYYTVPDLESFQREKQQSVSMIKMLQRFSGKNKNDPTIMAKYAQVRMQQANTTPMGLENHVAVSITELTRRRQNHWKAVLEEQWRQHGGGGGLRDPDEIAKVSLEGSEWARKRARVIGALHAGDDDCKLILHAGQELEIAEGPSLPTPPSA
eukprot:CAMPEP_0172318406 /NCGR_PEP_ID=MMETSP1058-20130122/34792_1 /TAXON_ID=83371 /ORGANISM="Detonula confervacea, Strain CCMP 353" /LENGTH=251 /DNA_ID=CAMNT_0013033237 /DNA_START=221 /DNA_END=976 /DNA_ORIENTATION=-